MKSILRALVVLALCAGAVFSAESTVTSVSKAMLGDGMVYTFSWSFAAATDTAYVMGSTSETGFLVTNANDRQITLEYDTSESDADSIGWRIDVMGNHQASSATSDFKVLTTDTLYTDPGTLNITSDEIGNYPYLIFRFSGVPPNGISRSMVVRVMMDFDDKYIGGF